MPKCVLKFENFKRIRKSRGGHLILGHLYKIDSLQLCEHTVLNAGPCYQSHSVEPA